MKFSPSVVLTFICVISFNSLIFSQLSGNISYTLHRESNPTQDQLDAYAKIKAAMDSATGYYNQYTTLTKNLNIYYNTTVQTADASFNGTIRFGSSRSYMVVHTAMHEIAHTLGIGTTAEYRNLIKNNVFTGSNATAKLREIINDSDTLVHGDQQHFWPYGLNYASEVKSKQDLINHCIIVNEMCKDMFREELYKVCHLRSKVDGRYIVSDGNKLSLSSNKDSTSLVRMIALNGENVFRLEFGNSVLDIPNESKSAGIAAGLYSWNGGAHQRVVFEFEAKDSNVARLKMSHSGLYLRADGNRIIQDQATVSKESQFWEITADQDITLTRCSGNKMFKSGMEFSKNRVIFITSIPEMSVIRITDLHGRSVRSNIMRTEKGYTLSTDNMARGLYVATIQLPGQNIRSRFVVK